MLTADTTYRCRLHGGRSHVHQRVCIRFVSHAPLTLFNCRDDLVMDRPNQPNRTKFLEMDVLMGTLWISRTTKENLRNGNDDSRHKFNIHLQTRRTNQNAKNSTMPIWATSTQPVTKSTLVTSILNATTSTRLITSTLPTKRVTMQPPYTLPLCRDSPTVPKRHSFNPHHTQWRYLCANIVYPAIAQDLWWTFPFPIRNLLRARVLLLNALVTALASISVISSNATCGVKKLKLRYITLALWQDLYSGSLMCTA
ncbi:hypothetical protein M427DRAFT_426845 [Gonapodya prolifera JEL478]|uniref:Uncharacterized protein n=1 Tax=Gonapodya prolifera (strain JEL478) TaxID=1344416 RepID=A0A139AT31_GONPJ|nr:hypothetical protein M427DRAFT_426845 [Gonapodya prolifera JEL478]|eukprot:KXS19655.1 hypothetical protein M427DRAFT_426845 [Gonapodya prolifera JEL478]